MRGSRSLFWQMLMACCVLLPGGAQAQSASLDRTPLPPPGHTIVPGEVPVQLPAPCADTTIIHDNADTLSDLHRPVLVLTPNALNVTPGLWHADFIIGTTGAPDRSSIAITWNGKPSQDGTFLAMIGSLRYQPASLNGCAVRFRSAMSLRTRN